MLEMSKVMWRSDFENAKSDKTFRILRDRISRYYNCGYITEDDYFDLMNMYYLYYDKYWKWHF